MSEAGQNVSGTDEINALRVELAKARERAAKFQAAFMELMRNDARFNSEWTNLVAKLDNRMCSLKASLDFHQNEFLKGAEVARLSCQIAVHPEVPPELIAEQIATKVKTMILERWQERSVLNG